MSHWEQRIGNIHNREDFARIVAAMADDLAHNPEGWENVSLAGFLGALAAFALDLDGYFSNRGETVPDEPSWSLMAQMLLAARIYE
ncbi:MAG: hypothetical protein EPO32_00685 [Anaerolineae bacterium]|nr:MAG: hypothetical protein EPO32_00685 [Anaerolineae bacterium]